VAKKIMALSLPEIKPRAWLPLARDALERRKTNPRFESVPLAEALMAAAPGLGVVDRWADAEAILRESLGMLTRLGGSHESLLECTDRLALALDEQNKPGAAYQVEAELLANLRASGSVRPVVLAESMGKVAYWSLRHPGESPRSLALYDEALDAFRKAAEDKRTAGFLVRAGGELTEHGHVAKGRTFSEEAMKLVKALPPTDGEGSSWGDTSISLAQTSIAVGYAAEGQRDEARRRFDIAWDLVVKHGIQNEFVGHIVKRERKSALRE
jgi:tetratricopeptide (TPR) repeat protein